MSTNHRGEEIVGSYIDLVADVEHGDFFKIEDHWQLSRLHENDFDRRHYGREFELKRTNASGTQGWVAGRFTRKSLTQLRDMLTEVLESES